MATSKVRARSSSHSLEILENKIHVNVNEATSGATHLVVAAQYFRNCALLLAIGRTATVYHKKIVAIVGCFQYVSFLVFSGGSRALPFGPVSKKVRLHRRKGTGSLLILCAPHPTVSALPPTRNS